ncbi:AraC family transcriptional regulator [Desulfovibrio mangrovi]|uniref:helix-turn-helix domain-containing protein n=1 Tax=Desulfovibrio mangrovi TaxID=2976983 RepID=UPI002246F55A|nr:AraC family transcriptional regulator [Desulfovibrio mangrovi]UZP69080.1 AraC family transcriptional regulator [Desulfovibrio mangrovi]
MKLAHVTYRIPQGLPGVELLSCPHAEVDFPPHVHDALTIWLNDSGGEYFRFKGNTSVLGMNAFGVVNPGEVHANSAVEAGPRNLRTIYVDTDWAESFFHEAQRTMVDGLYDDPELHNRLAGMHEALWHTADPLESQILFTQVFGQLCSRHGEGNRPAVHRLLGSESWRFRTVHELLQDSFKEEHSLLSLSEAANCTPQHLIRLFRRYTGVSPHTYLVCLRVAHAKHLLRLGHTVADTAAACGFADQSHCTRWFRRLAGTTPSAYRASVVS